MNFDDYQGLVFERRPNGVLLITINRPEKYNAADERLHYEVARVWIDVHDDDITEGLDAIVEKRQAVFPSAKA